MENIILRIDDISANTNFSILSNVVTLFKEKYPQSKVIVGVNIFSKHFGITGQVYDDEYPFKDQPIEWFYDVNKILPKFSFNGADVASHGLLHFDHSKASEEMQRMSILTSCNLLNTDIFIAPFGRVNKDTINICETNHISLITQLGWKSLDYNQIDEKSKRWYIHLWKFNFEEICRQLKLGTPITKH